MSGFYHARSYIGHDRCPWANNQSIFQCFVETMVISFVNLTQEHSWEIFEIENYGQWSVPNHKIIFFFHSSYKSKKKNKDVSQRKKEFLTVALWHAFWPAWITMLLYLNLFWEAVAPSPMPISPNSILCLPGFHLSGHLAK